jgi:hypothetical protein
MSKLMAIFSLINNTSIEMIKEVKTSYLLQLTQMVIHLENRQVTEIMHQMTTKTYQCLTTKEGSRI